MTYTKVTGSPSSVTLTNPCLVIIATGAADNDNVHLGIDSVSVGGNSATGGQNDIGGQNNASGIYYYKNTSLTGSQSIAVNYHAESSSNYDYTVYIITAGYNTTTIPESTPVQAPSSSGQATNPSVTVVPASASDLVIVAYAGSSATTPGNWTADSSTTKNGSNIVIGNYQPAVSGSVALTTTMANNYYSMYAMIIKGTGGGGGPVASPEFLLNLV
jgi:hypothetical protein